MLGFKPEFGSDATILCLGAHCDDIEIGCSGALLELQRRYRQVRIHWVVFSSDDVRERETRAAAGRLFGAALNYQVEVLKFRGSYFPHCGSDIKDAFESLRLRVSPDLIFTHFLNDRHQDHRVIAELTWNTFRNHSILEYEIPKYEGDLGHPNFYVPLADTAVTRKVDMLMESFPSQYSRTWFQRDLFLAHLRLRGIECNAISGYAEAFHGRKLVL